MISDKPQGVSFPKVASQPETLFSLFFGKRIMGNVVIFCAFSEETAEDGERPPRSSSRPSHNLSERDPTDSRRIDRKLTQLLYTHSHTHSHAHTQTNNSYMNLELFRFLKLSLISLCLG